MKLYKDHPDGIFEIYGHSWGGQPAVDLATKLHVAGVPVERVATLDAVRFEGIKPPPQELHWINVYRPLTLLDEISQVPVLGPLVLGFLVLLSPIIPWMSFNETVATWGRQVGPQPLADQDIATDRDHAKLAGLIELATPPETSNNHGMDDGGHCCESYPPGIGSGGSGGGYSGGSGGD